jgi:hypothetical protein
MELRGAELSAIKEGSAPRRRHVNDQYSGIFGYDAVEFR